MAIKKKKAKKAKGKKKRAKPRTKKVQKPKGCYDCDHFKPIDDVALVRRGIGGKCLARKRDVLNIAMAVVEDKTISNTCPLYPIKVVTNASCGECKHFTRESDLIRMRAGTGGVCGKANGKVIHTSIVNNGLVPDDCPIH